MSPKEFNRGMSYVLLILACVFVLSHQSDLFSECVDFDALRLDLFSKYVDLFALRPDLLLGSMGEDVNKIFEFCLLEIAVDDGQLRKLSNTKTTILAMLKEKQPNIYSDFFCFCSTNEKELDLSRVAVLLSGAGIKELRHFFYTSKMRNIDIGLFAATFSALKPHFAESPKALLEHVLYGMVKPSQTPFSSLMGEENIMGNFAVPPSEFVSAAGAVLAKHFSPKVIAEFFDSLVFAENPVVSKVRLSYLKGQPVCDDSVQLTKLEMKGNWILFSLLPFLFDRQYLLNVSGSSKHPALLRYIIYMRLHFTSRALYVTNVRSGDLLEQFAALIPKSNFDRLRTFTVYLSILKYHAYVWFITRKAFAPPKKIRELLPRNFVVIISAFDLASRICESDNSETLSSLFNDSFGKIMESSNEFISALDESSTIVRIPGGNNTEYKILCGIAATSLDDFFQFFLARLEHISQEEAFDSFQAVHGVAKKKDDFITKFLLYANQCEFSGNAQPAASLKFIRGLLSKELLLAFAKTDGVNLAGNVSQWLLDILFSKLGLGEIKYFYFSFVKNDTQHSYLSYL